jgi:hypothetical protein
MSVADLIRPWWPGRDGDHIRADCPLLQQETDSPAEGSGWFNLATASTNLCPHCFAWNAECDGCEASLNREEGAPKNLAAAKRWTREHVCEPTFTLTPSIRPQAPAAGPAAGQPALFTLEPAA